MKNNNSRWDGVNRRKNKLDWLTKLMYAQLIFMTLLFAVSVGIASYGRPETSEFQIALFNLTLRDYWLVGFKDWLTLCLAGCAFLSLCTFIANQFRLKRSTDHVWFTPIIIFGISVISLFNLLW